MHRPTPWILAAVVGLVVAVGTPQLGHGPGATGIAGATAAAATTRPNVLFVLTDDLDSAELKYMPHTRALIGAEGATFDRYYVSNSLCCPSRTTTLRGQYAHNTGVWTNGGTNGGFERAYSTGIEQDTIATRLHHAGYLTSLTGKYLNGYPNGAPPNYVPPGWSNWASAVFGNPYSEYRYVLNQNQEYKVYGRIPKDYGTNVYMGLTNQFIRHAAAQKKPFFAYLSVYAPHQPATPARQDRAKFPTAEAPRTPSFDQADVSRMPKFIRDLPHFTPAETAAIDYLYRKRIRSLQAVDRGVVRLVQTLRTTKQLDNTYIVFASDNGFHLGQHRMPAGKQTAYEPDIHVPLMVRGPGVKAGTHLPQLAANIDLAPTFEAMAGVRPARFTDGRSLLPLVHGARERTWRDAILIEHRNESGETPPGRPTTKHPSTLEPADPDQQPKLPIKPGREIRDQAFLAQGSEIPDYDAVRTSHYLYVEYANGERELYDTHDDPDEIDNLAGLTPAQAGGTPTTTIERDLARQIQELRECKAAGCRVADREPAA